MRISDTCLVGELQWAGLCLHREMEKKALLLLLFRYVVSDRF